MHHESLKIDLFNKFERIYDQDGHIQITGRVDDVMNVSGHRIGTAEVEDAIVCLKPFT